MIPLPPPLMTVCFNGPCEKAQVEVPNEARIGSACALEWKNLRGLKRYAVYVLTEFQGARGLMYLKSYDQPWYAAHKVHEIATVVNAAVA